ncbi:MAG TPA: metallophosphoesterase family protein [Acidimicrobiales bacterium]|nr:metallophosphoesterase family protein [Acidimicrobiales bacterium]
MRLGVVSDIHGNVVALEAVLGEAEAAKVDVWWALGDLVLFGPRPVEVLEILAGLPGIAYVSGNTDRYTLTGAQPHPHRTPADAVGVLDLVERYSAMAGAIGWTRGALVQAGRLAELTTLDSEQRMELPEGSRLLGVHASPGRDDGPGISSEAAEEALAELLAGCEAEVVVGGHTHDPTVRRVGGVLALNAGSVGVPLNPGYASWMIIEADVDGVRAECLESSYDAEGVVKDLYDRGYPNAAWMETNLTGRPSNASE